MGEWIKRMSDADAATLRAEVDAVVKSIGKKGTAARIGRAAGLHTSTIGAVLKGIKVSEPTAQKIRHGLRHVLANPDETPDRVLRVQARYKEQEPLRKKLRAIVAERDMTMSEVGRAVGVNPGTIQNFLNKGASFMPIALTKVEKWLAKVESNGERQSKRETPPKRETALARQRPLPFQNEDRVAVIAARLSVHAPEAAPADTEKMFDRIVMKVGLETIETILQFYKSKGV